MVINETIWAANLLKPKVVIWEAMKVFQVFDIT